MGASDQIQRQFVGSSNESALDEALNFYKLVRGYSSALGMPIDYNDSKLLDFGCGWGRFLRFFWRDFKPENLYGIDTDPNILAECHSCGLNAILQQIEPTGKLPFPDNTFSHIIAYSVFSHLPEEISKHWISEISRVSKPGAVFVCTTEPRRFLDFIENIPDNTGSEWERALRCMAGDIELAKKKFDNGEFLYIPTGGGDYRSSDVYGDAVIPHSYIEREWSRYFYLRKYIEDSFWQAVVINQKF